MLQLPAAERRGLSIPPTYIGNVVPEDIIRDRHYIVKSLDAALFDEKDTEMFTYSTKTTGEGLKRSRVADAPIIVQECLEEKTDIRVTVVGREIFSASITREGREVDGDWRTQHKDNLEYSLFPLPEEVGRKILDLMDSLKLSFGGVDLALCNDKYYSIEVNPTGEWAWLTGSAGRPIAESIARLLETGG